LALSLIGGQKQIKYYDPKEILEIFCNSEFEGDSANTRIECFKLSPLRAEKEKKNDPELRGYYINLTYSQYYIVNNYKIVEVLADKNKATGKVIFQRIALHDGDSVKNCYKDQDTVIYKLQRIKGRWWIYDPPWPRIGYKTVNNFFIEYYKGISDWENHFDKLSGSQKKYYNVTKKKYLFFKSVIIP